MYAREGLLGDVLGAANRLAWSANACSLPAARTEQPSALVRPAFLFKLAPSSYGSATHAGQQRLFRRHASIVDIEIGVEDRLGRLPNAGWALIHLLGTCSASLHTKMPGWVVTLSCQGCDAVISSLQQLLLPFWRSFVLRISRLLRARTGSCPFVCSLASPLLHLLSPGERCRTSLARRTMSNAEGSLLLGNQPRHKVEEHLRRGSSTRRRQLRPYGALRASSLGAAASYRVWSTPTLTQEHPEGPNVGIRNRIGKTALARGRTQCSDLAWLSAL